MKLKVLNITLLSLVFMLSGCQLFSSEGLSDSEVNDFIRRAVDNLEANTGYVMEGDLTDQTFVAEFDGENNHIEGTFDGEESEIYTFGGDTYIYGSIPQLGTEPMWVKFSGGEETPISEDVEVESDKIFTDEKLTDEFLNENFKYLGLKDCPEGISGQCHVFEITEDGSTSTAFFTTSDERLIQIQSESTSEGILTITFDYDSTIDIQLPDEAAEAVDYEEIFEQFIQNFEIPTEQVEQ